MKKNQWIRVARAFLATLLILLLGSGLHAQENEKTSFMSRTAELVSGVDQYFADDYFKMLPLWVSFGSLLPSAGDGLLKLSIRLPVGVALPSSDPLNLATYVTAAEEKELQSLLRTDFGELPLSMGLNAGLEVNWQPGELIPKAGPLKDFIFGLRGLYSAQLPLDADTDGNLMKMQGVGWTFTPSVRKMVKSFPFLSVVVGASLHMHGAISRRQFKLSSFNFDTDELVSFDVDYRYKVGYMLADFNGMVAVGPRVFKVFGGYAGLLPVNYSADLDRTDVGSRPENFSFHATGPTLPGNTLTFDLSKHADDELMQFRNKFIVGVHVFGLELHGEWTSQAYGLGLFYNLVL